MKFNLDEWTISEIQNEYFFVFAGADITLVYSHKDFNRLMDQFAEVGNYYLNGGNPVKIDDEKQSPDWHLRALLRYDDREPSVGLQKFVEVELGGARCFIRFLMTPKDLVELSEKLKAEAKKYEE